MCVYTAKLSFLGIYIYISHENRLVRRYKSMEIGRLRRQKEGLRGERDKSQKEKRARREREERGSEKWQRWTTHS